MSGSSGLNFLKLLSQGIHASNASLSWRINWCAWKPKTVKVMIFFMSTCSSSLKANMALNNLCYFGTLIKYNLRIDFLLSGSLFTYLLRTLFWSQYCLDRVLQKMCNLWNPLSSIVSFISLFPILSSRQKRTMPFILYVRA